MQYQPLIEEVWSEDSEEENGSDLRVQPAERQRTGTSHEVAIDQRIMAAVSCPMPSSVSVRNSKHVRFGPTVISVTHNENVETVKARFMCLELETEKQAKRLRCSVAICTCWTMVISFTLVIYTIFLVTGHRTRLDISLNDTWYIRREGWLAMNLIVKEFLKLPVSLVIIAHTDFSYCNTISSCKEVVHKMQDREFQGGFSDIIPNFLVGGEGWVLEGRGANAVGEGAARARSITISFIGNYGRDTPDDKQFEHVAILLEVLLRDGILKEDYTLLGYCQLTTHVSNPGRKVVPKLKLFSHWNPKNVSECSPGHILVPVPSH